MATPSPLIFFPSIGKTVAIFIGATAFVVLGVLLGLYREQLDVGIVAVFICTFVGVPFFGLCGLYALFRLLVRRPSLIVDERGITDNASAVAVGLIRWDEIAEIYAYDFMGQRFLGIVPVDTDAVLARVSPIKRMLSRANRGLSNAPINIPSVGLAIPIDELLKRIREFHDAQGDRQPT